MTETDVKAPAASLAELADRCEQAPGPDRELDCLIHCAAKGWRVVYEGKNVFADMGEGMRRMLVGWLDPGEVQRNFHLTSDSLALPYTASLDAAMTLVPEGWHVRDLSEARRGWNVSLMRGFAPGATSADRAHAADTKSAALALGAAALRARAAQTQEG